MRELVLLKLKIIDGENKKWRDIMKNGTIPDTT